MANSFLKIFAMKNRLKILSENGVKPQDVMEIIAVLQGGRHLTTTNKHALNRKNSRRP